MCEKSCYISGNLRGENILNVLIQLEKSRQRAVQGTDCSVSQFQFRAHVDDDTELRSDGNSGLIHCCVR